MRKGAVAVSQGAAADADADADVDADAEAEEDDGGGGAAATTTGPPPPSRTVALSLLLAWPPPSSPPCCSPGPGGGGRARGCGTEEEGAQAGAEASQPGTGPGRAGGASLGREPFVLMPPPARPRFLPEDWGEGGEKEQLEQEVAVVAAACLRPPGPGAGVRGGEAGLWRSPAAEEAARKSKDQDGPGEAGAIIPAGPPSSSSSGLAGTGTGSDPDPDADAEEEDAAEDASKWSHDTTRCREGERSMGRRAFMLAASCVGRRREGGGGARRRGGAQEETIWEMAKMEGAVLGCFFLGLVCLGGCAAGSLTL